jgi:hypothetical protein
MIHGNVALGLQNLALVGEGVELNTNNNTIASGGAIVSWHPPRERLCIARDVWRKLKAQRIAAAVETES